MEKFFITILSIISASFSLCNFFMDYKKERYLIASIELVTAIMLIVSGVCAMWYYTLSMLT